MSDREALARAAKAQALLNDPELNNAFDAVRKSIHDMWEQTPIRDRDGAHELRLMLKLLDDVKANIQSVVNTGKVVAHNQSLLDRAKKLVRR